MCVRAVFAARRSDSGFSDPAQRNRIQSRVQTEPGLFGMPYSRINPFTPAHRRTTFQSPSMVLFHTRHRLSASQICRAVSMAVLLLFQDRFTNTKAGRPSVGQPAHGDTVVHSFGISLLLCKQRHQYRFATLPVLDMTASIRPFAHASLCGSDSLSTPVYRPLFAGERASKCSAKSKGRFSIFRQPSPSRTRCTSMARK